MLNGECRNMHYHLLITSDEGAWEKKKYSYEIDRVMRGYTETDIANKYKNLTKSAITELKKFPAVFVYETPSQIHAKVGFFTRVEVKAKELEIEYEFFSDSPSIPVEVFSDWSKELNIGKLEMYRTHWAVKNADLFRVLVAANILTKEKMQSLNEQLAALGNGDIVTDPLESGQIKEMPQLERQNSGLALLMLLVQAYYRILAEATSLSNWATFADLELNHSYLWVTTSLKKLIANHPDLKDFPGKFEPILENLLPSTIGNIDWQEMLAPEVEQLLGQAQKYYIDKGGEDLEKDSAGWAFIELYRPSIERAINQAIAYNKKVAQYVKQTFPGSFPKSSVSKETGGVAMKDGGQKEASSGEKKRVESVREMLLEEIFSEFNHKAQFLVSKTFRISHSDYLQDIDDLVVSGILREEAGKYAFHLRPYIDSKWWREEQDVLNTLLPALKRLYKANPDGIYKSEDLVLNVLLADDKRLLPPEAEKGIILLEWLYLISAATFTNNEVPRKALTFRIREDVLRYKSIEEKITAAINKHEHALTLPEVSVPSGASFLGNIGRSPVIQESINVPVPEEAAKLQKGLLAAGQYFDAKSLIKDIFKQASKEICIVDSYVGEEVLSLLTAKPPMVTVKLLTGKASLSFLTLVRNFNLQYKGLEVRFSKSFHDRFVLLDNNVFYHFGASLEHLGSKNCMFSKIEEPSLINAIKKQWADAWDAAQTVK